ncbi:L,D-transpeptidase [Actinomycetospora endophytica]|uniref:L,D-transpeptidase n=1 Tax=Actinomycetospora endophytica TaxID=2291215 RepID=A0ABS8P7I6_9PSEU|nr:L,D-transpeptidase [Actinomycetospora endophytica]MCD2193014.1 L,D-transpeptidase [Actinomycetospora endophytica]
MRRTPAPAARWRTGPALLLSLGVLLAMGAVLLVFAGGTDNSAPAAAAPVAPAAPAVAAVHPADTPSGPVALTPAELAKCSAAATACVDLAAHTAWLQQDGKPVGGPVEMLPGADTFKRPPGPTSSATPTGTFHVLRKDKDGYSTEFDEPMHHAVYFAPGGIAFHEGSLTTSSNGCIHLSAADATTFFDALRIGDGVTVF